MKVTKISAGTYKVEYNGFIFEIENMKEFGQDWSIKENDYFGEWCASFDTKKLCIEWIRRNYAK